LETRWTFDRPQQRLRARVGDSIATGAGAQPFRFGGFQIGNDFALAPSMITYPTPALVGSALAPSTVELYVNGILNARENVQAGPFEIDNAALLAGAGEARMVITDVLGRQQIISRPFFVTSVLLRPGLADWQISAGAERQGYGQDSDGYGKRFLSA